MRPIRNIVFSFAAIVFCCCFTLVISAQSTDQNFPTAVTSNEIDGAIKARDIGDSRSTSYFYTFDGGQGDVFINVVTKNFSGDIDVFTVEGLRPLTKMVIYADGSVSETGRLIYLRKPERLLLRVEGRSPNDDPATFKIKFAGSFIALTEQKTQAAPTIKSTEVVADSGVRVNSVGTIVEVLPKPQPSPKAPPESKESVPVAVAKNKKPEPARKISPPAKPPAKKENKDTSGAAKTPEKKPSPEPPAPHETAKTEKKEIPPANKPKKNEAPEVKTILKKTPKPAKTPVAGEKKSKEAVKKTNPPEESRPDPMASIRLIIQMKDGKVIERPMSEITKFSVDKGILTVIAKDGTTVKYSILDVAKVTIQ